MAVEEQVGKWNHLLQIAKEPQKPWPGYPNPIPPGKDFPKDWPIPKGLDVEGFMAHGPGDNRGVLENTGAVVKPDGKTWLLPTKDGKYREATDEETIEILQQLQHEDEYRWWQEHDHNQADAGAATKHLQQYQGEGGSLKHHSPEMRRLILNANVRKYQA